VEKIAKDYGIAIKPDAHPEAGHYYRSDHFSLSRVGIPSFSISEGLKFQGHDLAWGEAQAKDYVTNHYHKPSDEFHAGWDFQGLAMMASFGYELGAAATSQSEAIRWLPGDEFEKAQQRMQSRAIDGPPIFAQFLSKPSDTPASQTDAHFWNRACRSDGVERWQRREDASRQRTPHSGRGC
jgi:hypothetical protein